MSAIRFGAISAYVVLMVFPSLANAVLIDRGSGLIYDTVLDITWLQDANLVDTSNYDVALYGSNFFGQLTREDSISWASNLSYYDSDRNITWEDWRLPNMLPIGSGGYDLTWNYDGTTDRGFNILSPNSEMSHLYYVTLGNLGGASVSGVRPQPGWGLQNVGPFANIELSYWSESEVVAGSEYGYFSIFNGEQLTSTNATSSFKYAWAVRDGDVGAAIAAVPLPGALWLFSSGLLFLATRFRANHPRMARS